MKRKNTYLVLAIVGAVMPYLHFLPWLLAHGLDLPLFLQDIHANHVSEFFSADLFVSALVVLAFLIFERRRVGKLWWIPILGLLLFGVAVALPVLLYLREVTSPHAA
jgi:Terpene cyclase DEP1